MGALALALAREQKLGEERVEGHGLRRQMRLAQDPEIKVGARSPQHDADDVALGAPGRGPQHPLSAVDHDAHRALGGVRDPDAPAECGHLDTDGPIGIVAVGISTTVNSEALMIGSAGASGPRVAGRRRARCDGQDGAERAALERRPSASTA